VPTQLQILKVARINGIMQGLQDVRQMPASLRFNARTPVVPCTDNEILGRYVGRVQIADLVADDAAAATYTSGKLTFETMKIPNLKHGKNLTQEELNQLLSLQAGNGIVGSDMGLISDWESKIVSDLRLGIQQRQEALNVACRLDGFSYDRLGIKMTGVSWGCPADLKVTPTYPWTDTANATPVDNLLAVKLTGSTRYGIDYDRATMSTAAFRAAIKTAEFTSRARILLPSYVQYSNISQYGLAQQIGLFEAVSGLKIELYDSRYWQQQSDGTLISAPYLPVNMIILEDSTNDNTEAAFDFGNAIVTESVVSSLTATNMIGSFTGPVRGPIAYATAPPDLNPPNITYWGVARGFPRRKLLQASATLNVGTVIDPIPITEPPVS